MKITHFGHACVLIETATARILIDPGTLSNGFEGLRDLTALLITHTHEDHFDLPRVEALLEHNTGAVVLADRESAPSLGSHGSRAVDGGNHIDLDGATIDVLGGTHAAIFENFPGSANVGYLIDGGSFFHPGDALDIPDVPIDVLGLPISGPWLKLGEAIGYLREIAPRVAIPIHEAAWADLGMPHFMVGNFTPEGTTFTPLQAGVATEV
jgi:L-ascorbate metabolism protein UlaG (beta-lactamase superfamily)